MMGRLLLSALIAFSSAGSIPGTAWAQLSPAAISRPRAGASPLLPILSDQVDPPFNNNNTPLNDQEFLLINQNGYRIQADGTIRAPGSLRPLGQAELQTDIEQLIGRKRLKAMLELDLVFSKYGYKNLPADALADVRRVARQNWALLPEQVRVDLRQYFTGPELESIDQGVKIVRAPATWMPLEAVDIPPEALSNSAIPSAPAASPAAPSVVISPMAAMNADAQAALSAVSSETPLPNGPSVLAASPVGPNSAPTTGPAASAPVAAPMATNPPPTQNAPLVAAGTPTASPIPATPLAPTTTPVAPAAVQAAKPNPATLVAMAPVAAPIPAAVIAPVSNPLPSVPTVAAVVPAAAPTPAPALTTVPAISANTPSAAIPSAASPQATSPQNPTALPVAPVQPSEQLQRLRQLEAAAEAGTLPTTAALNPEQAPSQGQAAPTVFKAAQAPEPPRLQIAATAQPVPPPVTIQAMPPAPSPAAVEAVKSEPRPQAPTPSMARYGEISSQDFDRFMQDAPYGHEAQAMLKMIEHHAPSDLRRQALGVIIAHVPLVVIDTVRSGLEPYAAVRRIHNDDSRPGEYLVILNPGPVRLRKHSVFFSGRQFLVPDDPAFYRDLGVSAPDEKAMNSEATADSENKTAWGQAREYSDGSERLKYSEEQMAGTLLGELVKLDAKPLAAPSDQYRLELLARSAQFALYRKLRADNGTEPVLDQNLRAEYAEWLGRPEDEQDLLIEAMAAPAAAMLLPSVSGSEQDRAAWKRHYYLSLLDQAGIELPKEAKKSLGSLPTDVPTAASASMDESVVRDIKGQESNSPINATWLFQEGKMRNEIYAGK